MADANITILRQDYRDAAQVAASADAQYNGWEANTISTALASSATSIVGYGSANTDKAYIPADFKDHKTVFIINNTYGATKTVTFKKGDSYQGVNDLVITAPAGLSVIWLESAPFVNQKTGKIIVETDATSADAKDLTIVGYEMR